MTKDRKARFKAALALAGLSQKEYAENWGVTSNYVAMVIRGDRESADWLEQIDSYIAEQEKKAAARYGDFTRVVKIRRKAAA